MPRNKGKDLQRSIVRRKSLFGFCKLVEVMAEWTGEERVELGLVNFAEPVRDDRPIWQTEVIEPVTDSCDTACYTDVCDRQM